MAPIWDWDAHTYLRMRWRLFICSASRMGAYGQAWANLGARDWRGDRMQKNEPIAHLSSTKCRHVSILFFDPVAWLWACKVCFRATDQISARLWACQILFGVTDHISARLWACQNLYHRYQLCLGLFELFSLVFLGELAVGCDVVLAVTRASSGI